MISSEPHIEILDLKTLNDLFFNKISFHIVTLLPTMLEECNPRLVKVLVFAVQKYSCYAVIVRVEFGSGWRSAETDEC